MPSSEEFTKKKSKKSKTVENEENCEIEVLQDDKALKKKEKKKKRKLEEAAQKQTEETNNEDEDANSDKKKKKKKKTVEANDSKPLEIISKSKKKSTRGGQFEYFEHADVSGLSKQEVEVLRGKLDMTVDVGGSKDIRPVTEFKQAGFPAKLQAFLLKSFERPSPIQSQCWPIILQNRDLIGIASTGSGKTLAFGGPGVTMCSKTTQVEYTPCMAVVAPTRELALQIGEVLTEVGAAMGVCVAIVFGGVPKKEQERALKAAHIVVATPGRLQDLMQQGTCDLSRVKYLVLDEADRMLDLGFEPDIRAIVGACPASATRQTVMFSATWPREAAKLANDFLLDAVKVTIGSAELSASHSVTQRVEVLEMSARDERVDQLLKKYHNKKNRVLIFVLYKKEAPRLEQTLKRKGWSAVAIHGDMTQEGRLRALAGFKDGSTPMMIATDVAARGLDIPDVEYVINYSFPLTVEDYVHRIGRTGRAGKTGIAHTFFTVADKLRAGELVNVLREAKQDVPSELLKFGTHVKKKESKLYGAHFKDVDMNLKAKKTTFGDSDDDE
mmetsp:Transcript_15410/g.21251  ORF Transcript_15410/g.21251 Transcript_15410/m.21251 type:complete len:555 (+) Transcript_15410:148-1812(+)|eukprot:CAMPEP_0196586016 /NCGR_PEP_ID=MMETSP1081-20130531/52865_1 /TAXON_ID=36882 /ORGANISM="Pyramimonas amylifera, Strain CCMP720" /LENGTH=554 /DNA_ID=CAMNT_0041907751 /DNA_START=147 /DNA_END=1811 /DNA_ORIENTATION=-